MKKLKNIVLSLAFLTAIPFLHACTPGQVVIKTLQTPTNVTAYQNSISWDAVENADYYEVAVNGEVYRTQNTNLSINMLTKSGKYEIFVVAYSNSSLYLTSEMSQVLNYDTRQKFSAPTNFSINKQTEVLSWTKVESAQNYVLSINGATITLTSRDYRISGNKIYFDLANYQQYLFEGRENTFSVCVAETSRFKASEQSSVVKLVKTAEQPSLQNIKVAKSGKKIFLTFDELESAQSGYTYFVDNGDGVHIENSGADISENFVEFGEYNISVIANQVLTDDGEILFLQSEKAEVTFENIPTFVDQSVQNISVSRQTLKFDGFDDALQYQIKITKNFYEQSTVLADFSILQQQYIENNGQVDISEYTSQVGKYLVEIVATQTGRDQKLYQSAVATSESLKVAGILQTPTMTVQNDGSSIKITIQDIENASSVLVFLNDDSYPLLNISDISENEIVESVPKVLLLPGNNQLFCKAVGDKDLFYDSGFSSYQTFKIAQVNVPDSLKISDDGVLTFAYVGDFERFLIYVNDDQVGETDVLRYQLNINKAGKYNVQVSAYYQGSEGVRSRNVEFVKREKLTAPTNIKVASKILTFDAVLHAESYNVYITNSQRTDFLAFSKVSSTRLTLADSMIARGENQIKIVANGDGEIYLTSDYSETYSFRLTESIDQVTGIVEEIKNEKYFLKFDGVNRASKYIVDITTPSQKTFSVESTQPSVDIDRYMTEKGTYNFDVTAISNSTDFSNSLASQAINFDKMYNKLYYQSNNFFYDGHQYSFVFSDEYSIQDFVFYAVLYGIDEAQVYIDNSNSAFDLQNKTLKSYLPCLSNFDIDFSNGNDLSSALMPLLTSMDSTKISNAMKLIERAHDQLYLYFDIDDSATKQTNASINQNVYTIKISYQNGFTINPTNNHGKQLVEKYDVVERTDFAIDNLTKTAPVETVGQLLMAVQNGRKPEFTKPNTDAELTYEYAKNVLSKICNNSMTDAEKAVAIHDWIVINNKYANDTYQAASGEPFSIDNLNDMSFFASGTLLYHYSVCTGYAQTFALLCSIEGIEAITTFGLCGSDIDYSKVHFDSSRLLSTLLYLVQKKNSLANIGAHSWNRVNIDIGNGKQWYIVDATWDDPDNASKPNAVIHTYMFVNDNFVETGRKEFFPNGDLYHRTDVNGNVINYNATDTTNYYDYAGAVASTNAELVAVVQKLEQSDSVVVKYNQQLSESIIRNAITSAGLNANDYAIYIYSSNFAYIYKK